MDNRVRLVRLVRYSKHHDEQTVSWLHSPEMKETFGLSYSPTLAEHRRWISEQENLYMWAIEYGSQHVGNASLRLESRHSKALLEIYVGAVSCRGKGVGREALVSVLEIGFSDLGLNRIHLFTRTTNTIAEKLYRDVGFRLEGTERQSILQNEEYLDQNLWSLLASEWTSRK